MSSIVIAGDTSGSVTLQAPAVSGSSVLTLPAVTDTVAGIAATQTLTNKTLTSPTLTTPVASTTIGVGAATPSASGAGITFPATQSASTNANTLDDYEEGTWTPTAGGDLTVVGTFSSSGKYTKIGNIVYAKGIIAATTSIAIAGGQKVMAGGLPFSADVNNGYGVGTGFTSGGTATCPFMAAVTDLYSEGAGFSATANFTFSVVFSV